MVLHEEFSHFGTMRKCHTTTMCNRQMDEHTPDVSLCIALQKVSHCIAISQFSVNRSYYVMLIPRFFSEREQVRRIMETKSGAASFLLRLRQAREFRENYSEI